MISLPYWLYFIVVFLAGFGLSFFWLLYQHLKFIREMKESFRTIQALLQSVKREPQPKERVSRYEE